MCEFSFQDNYMFWSQYFTTHQKQRPKLSRLQKAISHLTKENHDVLFQFSEMLNHQTYFQFSHRWEKKLKKFVSITHFFNLFILISFLEPLRLLEHSSASGTVLMQVKNDAKTIGSNAKSTLTSLSHHICLLTPQHFGKDISSPICLTMPSFWDIGDFRTESDKK